MAIAETIKDIIIMVAGRWKILLIYDVSVNGLVGEMADCNALSLKLKDKGLIPFFSYDPHQYIHTYRNSQTTSTKCQYHAAASKPKWWFLEK